MSQSAAATVPQQESLRDDLAVLWQSRALRIYVAAVGLATALLYAPTFHWLYTIWRDDKEYSHGFLVPLIALYLCWIKRDQVRSIAAKPDYALGIAGLLASAALVILGRAGGYPLIGSISFLLFLPSTILLFFGWRHVRKLALPLAYLQFMVPWMDPFMEKIYPTFQVFSAELAVGILRLFGYPVLQNGKYIYMTNVAMEVAKECSGIRFLTTVVALGIPLVYLSQRTWKRAFSVLGLGCLIAILMNGVRVAIAGMLGEKYGPNMLHGPFHIFQGWFVAQTGLIFMFLINWWVERMPNPDKITLATRGAQPLASAAHEPKRIPVPALGAFAAGCAVLGTYLIFFAAPKPQPLAQPLDHLPVYIGQWRGMNSQWIQAENFYPGADDHVMRTYRDAEGRVVHIYLAHFGIQTADKAAITFRERGLHTDSRLINIAGHPAMESTAEIDGSDYQAVTWFEVAGKPEAERVPAKLKGFLSAVLHQRNDTTVVLISEPAPAKGSTPSQTALEFSKVALPEIEKLLHQ